MLKYLVLVLVASQVGYSQDIIGTIANLFCLPEITNPNLDASDVHFLLYTRANPDVPINITNTTLNAVNTSLITKFITHGWTDYPERLWIQEMKNAYLFRGNYNVIVVDWSYYADNWNYVCSYLSVQGVGRIVGQFITILYTTISLDPNRTHLVGFSLGAHVSGVAGRYFEQSTGVQLYRITGLDAAGPLFAFLFLQIPAEKRLTAADAENVDGIHTNALEFGYLLPYAKADFYPNSGKFQPGCLQFNYNTSLSLFDNVFNYVFCSHTRAPALFTESIYSDNFLATPCFAYFAYENHWCNGQRIIMGEDWPVNTTGKYFLDTNANYPYAQG